MKKFPILIAALATVLSFCAKETQSVKYPVTKKVEQVDDYFGTKVADPYRWLEDDNAEEVKQWVRAENEVTFGYLSGIPFREKIRRRLTDIYNYPRYSSPMRAGEYYFFYKNDGLQNQPVIYIQKGLEGAPEVFIDPNALSADGTVRIGLLDFSPDFKYVAVSPTSSSGSSFQGRPGSRTAFSTAGMTSRPPGRNSRPKTSSRRSVSTSSESRRTRMRSFMRTKRILCDTLA